MKLTQNAGDAIHEMEYDKAGVEFKITENGAFITQLVTYVDSLES